MNMHTTEEEVLLRELQITRLINTATVPFNVTSREARGETCDPVYHVKLRVQIPAER